MRTAKLLHYSLLLFLLAGCATQAKYGAFVPKGELAPSTGTAYDNYGTGMSHVDGYQMACEWQRNDRRKLMDTMKDEVLVAFVKDDASADALLARIGTAYDGDPTVLTQIAAVTQVVMRPKCPEAPARRKIWVAALERARAKTDDGYVRTFCDQQLRICK